MGIYCPGSYHYYTYYKTIFKVLNLHSVSVLLFPCNCMLHFIIKVQTARAGQMYLDRSQNNHMSHHASNF